MAALIQIDGATARLTGTPAPAAFLRECLSWLHPGRFFNQGFKQGRWDGRVCLADGNQFPAGFAQRVRKHLVMQGVACRIVSRGSAPVSDSFLTPAFLHGIKLRDYQLDAIRTMLRRPRGALKEPTGCHAAGQGILLMNGQIVRVEDVRVGDRLAGHGSARVVQKLIRGRGRLVRIVPTRGAPWVVNEDHILTLVRTRDGSSRAGALVDVSVRDWMSWSRTRKHVHKLLHAPVQSFALESRDRPIDAYVLGVLLGDGTLSGTVRVTTPHCEILATLRGEARSRGLTLAVVPGRGCFEARFSAGRFFAARGGNSLLDDLRHLGLWRTKAGTKFIPDTYKCGPRAVRLAILAGLLDTDGHLSCGVFDYISKSPRLAADVAFVARSLGLFVSSVVKTVPRYGRFTRLTISGHVSMVPNVVPKKRAKRRQQKKNPLRTGFRVEAAGSGKFFGFELDGDGRYLLDDFTLTHNSGKTAMVAAAARLFWEEKGWRSLIVVPRKGLAGQTRAALQRFYDDGIRVGIVGDGHRQAGPIVVGTAQTLAHFAPRTVRKRGRKPQRLAGDPWLADLLNQTDVLFLDECHRSKSDQWQSIASACPAVRRYGLSGTPLQEIEFNDIKLEGQTGPLIHETQATALIDRRLAARPKIVMVMSDRASTRVEKVLTLRHGRDVMRDPDYRAAYNQAIVESDAHNNAVLASVKWLRKRKRRVLVLCRLKAHFVKLAEGLADLGIEAACLWGSTHTEDRDEAKRAFADGEIECILATTIFDEGEDVGGIDAIVLAEGVSTNTSALQRIGRGMRPDSDDVWVVDIVPTGSDVLMEHAARRAEVYEREGYEVVVLEKWPSRLQPAQPPKDLLPFETWA